MEVERTEPLRVCRLLEPIGNIPPDEAEERFYAQIEELNLVA